MWGRATIFAGLARLSGKHDTVNYGQIFTALIPILALIEGERIGLELYIADLAPVGIARHFEQQRDSSRLLDSANEKRLLIAL